LVVAANLGFALACNGRLGSSFAVPLARATQCAPHTKLCHEHEKNLSLIFRCSFASSRPSLVLRIPFYATSIERRRACLPCWSPSPASCFCFRAEPHLTRHSGGAHQLGRSSQPRRRARLQWQVRFFFLCAAHHRHASRSACQPLTRASKEVEPNLPLLIRYETTAPCAPAYQAVRRR
jgi:hypothetical protein